MFDVQTTQAPSGDTVIKTGMGAVISTEGHVLATATPFSEGRQGIRPIRTRTVGWLVESPANRIDFEVVAVDESVNLALLRAQQRSQTATGARAQTSSSEVAEGTRQGRIQSALRPLNIASAPQRDEAVVVVAVDEGKLSRMAAKMSPDGSLTLAGGKRQVLPGGAVVLNIEGSLVGLVVERTPAGNYAVARAADAVSMLAAASIVVPGSGRAAAPIARADVLRISEMLDQHDVGIRSVPYERVYHAPPGFRIADTQFLTGSANGVAKQPIIKKSQDEKTVVVQFALSSGPAWDKWRGWLDGELRVQLVPDR